MKFTLSKNNQGSLIRLRRLGYAPYRNKRGKDSFVKRISGAEFPRFHLYVTNETETLLVCSIHIDQTAPSYKNGSMHRGEYTSPVVAAEVARIAKTNH